jgi:hypothetical protein
MVSAGAVACAPRGPIDPGAPEPSPHRIPNEPDPITSKRTRHAKQAS